MNEKFIIGLKTDFELLNICHASDIKKDLFAINGENQLRLYELKSNSLKFLKKFPNIKKSIKSTDMEFHPIDNILTTTNGYDNEIYLWDIQEKFPKKMGKHNRKINKINWSTKNTNLLISCSQDCTLKIWDKKINMCDLSKNNLSKPVQEKKLNGVIFKDCKFNKNDEFTILTSLSNGFILLYDLRKFDDPFKKYIYHSSDEISVDWHPLDKNIFCSSGKDKNLNIWDINNENYILNYKTEDEIFKLKWYNNKYILSIQFKKYTANLWNTNIPYISEYIYSGHEKDITGFCWDNSNEKLITCSRDCKVIIRDFKDGLRQIDNISNNIIKISSDNQLMYYHEYKQHKKRDFNEVNNEKETKFNIKYNNVKKEINVIHKLKFDFLNNNIENNKNNFFNNCKELNQYYIYDKKLITKVFKGYIYILDSRILKKNKNNLNLNENMSLTEKLKKIVLYNYEFSKNEIKIDNHIVIWKELNFLTEQLSFEKLNENMKIKKINNLYFQIVENKILQIIEYLIEIHNDIYLATLITILFFIFLESNKKIKQKIINLQQNCRKNLLTLKLFVLGNKISKFGFKEIRDNPIFLLSCMRCKEIFENNSICLKCNRDLLCNYCNKKVIGIFELCLGCGHGGHIYEEINWFKDNYKCKICEHECNKFKNNIKNIYL